MPRFYFNVYDGEDWPDLEGVELPDWQAAQLEAITTAGTIIRDRAKRIELGEDWRMEVTDDTGLILFQLDFHIAPSTAIQASRKQTLPDR